MVTQAHDSKARKHTEHTWNHRVCMRRFGKEVIFGIHEAHYDGKKLRGVTMEAVSVTGDNLEELKVTLERMLRCLKKSVIDYDKLKPRKVAK